MASKPTSPSKSLSKGLFTCPVCHKKIPRLRVIDPSSSLQDPPPFPFCSKKCAYVDLGVWLRGEYVLPGTPLSGTEEETYLLEEGGDSEGYPPEDLEEEDF